MLEVTIYFLDNLSMESIYGATALSAFKSSKLLGTLKISHPAVCSLSAQFVHLLDCDSDFLASESKLLNSLLSYGESYVLSLIHI